jgi:hypothetical protein
MSSNGHHVLFEKSLWRSNEPLKKLRASPGLKPGLDSDIHNSLHAACGFVPAFNYVFASQVFTRFIDRPNNPNIAVENLLFAIDDVVHNRRLKQVEKQVGELAIISIEMQRPFIKDGLL